VERAFSEHDGDAHARDRGSIVMMIVPFIPGIGAAFGGKGCIDHRHIRAQAHQHVENHPVTAQQHMILVNFGGQVTVADVPGQFDQFEWRGGAHQHQRLGHGLNQHHAPIGQAQPVPMAQQHRSRQIEHEIRAVIRDIAIAAAMARIIIQRYGRRLPGPMIRRAELHAARSVKGGLSEQEITLAKGNSLAGSQVSNSPSARTS
jgi:hypothetical protein